MAFVDITTPKSPAGVAALLLQCKSGKRQLTPELCFDILNATNFAKNIRDMLSMIAELPAEKQAAFKNVLLSTFERREQPNDVVILGKKLAVSGGYEAEFNDMDKFGDAGGEYLLSGVGKRVGIAVFLPDRRADYSGYDEVFFASDDVDLVHCDLTKIKKMRFCNGAEVELSYVEKLPENLDVSMCNIVLLRGCNLASVKKLRFKEGSEVDLFKAKNLPAELDVLMCDKLDLRLCDLAQVKNLRFKDGADVDLFSARNLPKSLDVSMCNNVNLYQCDFSNVKQLHFKNQAQRENSRAVVLDTVKVTYDEGASLWPRFLRSRGR